MDGSSLYEESPRFTLMTVLFSKDLKKTDENRCNQPRKRQKKTEKNGRKKDDFWQTKQQSKNDNSRNNKQPQQTEKQEDVETQ